MYVVNFSQALLEVLNRLTKFDDWRSLLLYSTVIMISTQLSEFVSVLLLYCHILHSRVSFYNHILYISSEKKTADLKIRAMVAATAPSVNFDM